MITSFRSVAIIACAVSSIALLASPAQAIAVSCQAFMDNMQARVGDLKPQFVRPVVVSRGAALFGSEVRDLITTLRIDGQLFCDGDRFVRFEMKMHAPFSPRLQKGAERIQIAAASFKLQWPAGKTAATMRRMQANAAEYLRASAERGDVFISGKVEEHAGTAGDVALVWTRSDRSFILVEYRP